MSRNASRLGCLGTSQENTIPTGYVRASTKPILQSVLGWIAMILSRAAGTTVLTVALLAGPQAFGVAVRLDNFDGAKQTVTLTSPPLPTSSDVFAANAAVLGNSREFQATFVGGSGELHTGVSGLAEEGYRYLTDNSVAGEALIAWDGNADNLTSLIGLGGVDYSQVETVKVRVFSSSGGGRIEFTFYDQEADDANSYVSGFVDVPGSITDTVLDIPVSSFTLGSSVTSAATVLDSVGAMHMRLNGLNAPGWDANIDYVELDSPLVGMTPANPLLPLPGPPFVLPPPFPDLCSLIACNFKIDLSSIPKWLKASNRGRPQRLWVDPEVAEGYIYELNSGPNFESVVLPSGFLDSNFTLTILDPSHADFGVPIPLVGDFNTEYSFGDSGINMFLISDIEPAADTGTSGGFVVGLSFVDSDDDEVIFRQIAVSKVPEPATALWVLTFAVFATDAMRRQSGRSHFS